MTQWLQCLQLEHEDLTSDPQNPHLRKPGVAAHSCNPSSGSGDQRIQWLFGQPFLLIICPPGSMRDPPPKKLPGLFLIACSALTHPGLAPASVRRALPHPSTTNLVGKFFSVKIPSLSACVKLEQKLASKVITIATRSGYN